MFPQEKGLVKLIIIPVDARHAAEKIERTLVNPSFMVSGLGGYRRVLTRFAFFSFIEIVKTVQTCKITGNLTAKRQENGSAAKN